MQKVNFYIGAEFFREIRGKKRYYVDKTAFIEEFLTSSYPQVSLITRPRRFGKTLTMNTLKEFFDITAENKNLFEGLAVSQNKELCKEWQNQYPVIYLTLKGCEGINFENSTKQFAHTLKLLCAKFQRTLLEEKLSPYDSDFFRQILTLKADQSVLSNALLTLSDILHRYYHKKIILLIDEYDVPINNAYHYGFYEDMILFMRNFLGSVLKGNEFLEFAVLTGCLRIAKESIFTGLNNFKCFGISDTKFSNAIGFTSDEVDKILADAGLEDKKPLIKEWYDGYTFGKQTEIYCPWDVSNYVAELQSDPELEPKLYWNRTSGNDIIKDFLCRTDFNIKKKFETLVDGGCVEIKPSDQQTYNMLHCSEDNFWNILYSAGYLTKANEEQIQRCGKTTEHGKIFLTIPNKEVSEIYKEAITEWFSQVVIPSGKKKLINAFWQGKADIVSMVLSDILENSISCRDYSESFYHGILFGLFADSDCEELSNRESGLGYYDLLIIPRELECCAIIEIKRADKVEHLQKGAEKALEQISSKKYDAFQTRYRKVIHWGIAFYKKSCMALVKKEN